MQAVDNPKKLFQRLEAKEIESDEYEFNIGEVEDTPSEELSDAIGKEQVQLRTVTVEFKDLSDPADDFHTSLDAIKNAAREVDDFSEVPDSVNAKFRTQEDGTSVIYMADADRMGYEVIKQEEGPRLAGYAVIFPDKLVKMET